MAAKRSQTVSSDLVPAVIPQLAEFLTRMHCVGRGAVATELSFWRTRTQIDALTGYTEELRKLMHQPAFLEAASKRGTEVQQAFEAVRAQVQAMVDEVPFEKRVNLLHRSLIPCYQQLFVLENLLHCILVRLQHQQRGSNVQAGSLLSADSRRQLRKSLHNVVPCWDKGTWDLYDTV